MPKLNSKRLLLRPMLSEDIEAVFNYRSDHLINQYQGWVPETIEDVEEFIRKLTPTINVADSWFQFSIILKETNQLIGDLGVHFIDNEGLQSELGCTISQDYHQQGFATEALTCVVDYLFKVLDKHRIHASVDPRNMGSVKLLDRLGFRKEAHFKESLLINNEWVDDVIYAVLKSEWPL